MLEGLESAWYGDGPELSAWTVIIVPRGTHSLVRQARRWYAAPHFEVVLIHGVGQCPTSGWGLWLVLCALEKPLTLSGPLMPRMGGNQEPYGLRSGGRDPASCGPAASSWGTLPQAGSRGEGADCPLSLPHPGQRFLQKLPPGSLGAL